jgi:hypothetical protein
MALGRLQSRRAGTPEELDGFVLPKSVKKGGVFLALARAYKLINAPVGPLGLASLRASKLALKSGNAADDSSYTNIENQLTVITNERNNSPNR